MTDNEIIKALESCSERDDCEGCLYGHFCNGDLTIIVKYALDLIKRKDEQIEGLIAGQETLQKALNEKIAEIERLKNSRDRWKKNALDFDEASRETEKELERLYEMVGEG